jgi:hypothetical protein
MCAELYLGLHATCPYLTKPEIKTGHVKYVKFTPEQAMRPRGG